MPEINIIDTLDNQLIKLSKNLGEEIAFLSLDKSNPNRSSIYKSLSSTLQKLTSISIQLQKLRKLCDEMIIEEDSNDKIIIDEYISKRIKKKVKATN